MDKFLKKVRSNMLMNAILTILVGLLFILNPKGTSNIICNIFAIAIIIAGIVDLVRYLAVKESGFVVRDGLVSAIMKILLGAFIFAHSETMVDLLAYVFGVFMILMGVKDIEHAIPLLKNQIGIALLTFLVAALLIIGGIITLFTPLAAIAMVMTVIGIGVILCGAIEIVVYVMMRRTTKSVEQAIKDANAIDV